MNTLRFGRYALWMGAAIALLAGCGGQTQVATPGVLPQAIAPLGQTAKSKSWMLPEAKSGDLLYTTGGCGGTCVLSYPAGKLVGKLSVGGGVGVCSDSKGDVFIPNNTMVVEYAHGGTTPIQTLDLPGSSAAACAIDATTGNLAVIFEGSDSDVAIFPDAQGEPNVYVANLDAAFCGYDNSGNLFVDGYANGQTGLTELPDGSSQFLNLTISGDVGLPWQVQWDGHYITLEGQAPSKGNITVAELQIAGSIATVVNTTHFAGVRGRVTQSWIHGGDIFIPYGVRVSAANKVGAWKYPGGGDPFHKIKHLGKKGTLSLGGVTLSPKT